MRPTKNAGRASTANTAVKMPASRFDPPSPAGREPEHDAEHTRQNDRGAHEQQRPGGAIADRFGDGSGLSNRRAEVAGGQVLDVGDELLGHRPVEVIAAEDRFSLFLADQTVGRRGQILDGTTGGEAREREVEDDGGHDHQAVLPGDASPPTHFGSRLLCLLLAGPR